MLIFSRLIPFDAKALGLAGTLH